MIAPTTEPVSIAHKCPPKPFTLDEKHEARMAVRVRAASTIPFHAMKVRNIFGLLVKTSRTTDVVKPIPI